MDACGTTTHCHGQHTCKFRRHCSFLSHSLYRDYVLVDEYEARKKEQNEWQKNGWGPGNPWKHAKLLQETDLGSAAKVLKLKILNSIKRFVYPLQNIRHYFADLIHRFAG
jgi:hypothetical protein